MWGGQLTAIWKATYWVTPERFVYPILYSASFYISWDHSEAFKAIFQFIFPMYVSSWVLFYYAVARLAGFSGSLWEELASHYFSFLAVYTIIPRDAAGGRRRRVLFERSGSKAWQLEPQKKRCRSSRDVQVDPWSKVYGSLQSCYLRGEELCYECILTSRICQDIRLTLGRRWL